ncbi:hypothetical protein [Bradyrhizobium sp. CCBAU 11357]|uniref:hypothetical protein n=1 Tax=Bradyrhizobium sp. CCBAU 11357 TaxID=1630808 RepID=UPI002302066F|nr:hypothetical protein [Bradyrhizobium sp. CCBAU 11357]MDA9500654.1 hypothetical protein [Bradyrhizobium sp. CCBAU 11357]
MSSQQPLSDQVFILRFWREAAGGSGDGRWRVLVRNINTRRRDVVDDVQRAFAIVTANLNVAAEAHEEQATWTVEPPTPEQ